MSRIDAMFEELPPVLSVKDLTYILGKDRATVYRWLKKGEIPGILIESTWVIYRDEMKDYLLSRHNQAGSISRESVPAKGDAKQVDAGQEQDDTALS